KSGSSSRSVSNPGTTEALRPVACPVSDRDRRLERGWRRDAALTDGGRELAARRSPRRTRSFRRRAGAPKRQCDLALGPIGRTRQTSSRLLRADQRLRSLADRRDPPARSSLSDRHTAATLGTPW